MRKEWRIHWIAVDSAASNFGVHRVTLWRWIKRYNIETRKFLGDRRTHIHTEDYKKLINLTRKE